MNVRMAAVPNEPVPTYDVTVRDGADAGTMLGCVLVSKHGWGRSQWNAVRLVDDAKTDEPMPLDEAIRWLQAGL